MAKADGHRRQTTGTGGEVGRSGDARHRDLDTCGGGVDLPPGENGEEGEGRRGADLRRRKLCAAPCSPPLPLAALPLLFVSAVEGRIVELQIIQLYNAERLGTRVFPSSDGHGFLQCLREKMPSELVYTQSSSNFTDVLFSSIKNPKFFTTATDCFWRVRGGGGGSFGIVLSWKVQLVQVPPTVTVFNIGRMVDQGAVDILTRWQHIAPSLPSDLTIRVLVQQGQQALFQALYFGTCGALVATMGEQFPELGMTSADCQQMTWLQSAATPFLSFASNGTLEEVLLDRTAWTSAFTKAKSDYVLRAIPKAAWKEIFSRWFGMDGAGDIILEPHGGFMDSVPAAARPYPHRNGVLYVIQYIAYWQQQGDGGAAAKSWIGGLYDFMGQHVSTNPRRAYVNFRDLDIGQNDDDGTFESGKVWGERYFVGNYRRLAAVKAGVDPTNYFRNEQSIPPFMETTTQVI
uniref:Reticuline oxidase-like protein n=1 Tax=Aegilops tauschii TaxID=37682 RepID=M8BW20_AEGTA